MFTANAYPTIDFESKPSNVEANNRFWDWIQEKAKELKDAIASFFADEDLKEMDLIMYPYPYDNPWTFKIDENVPADFLVNHGFNASVPTKIISHGFKGKAVEFCSRFIKGTYKGLGFSTYLDWF